MLITEGGQMCEERLIIIGLLPFALVGAYHFFKWISYIDKKNGMK